MGEDEKIPMLLRFYFGEAAEAAVRGASERLMRWCRAYDEWLGERKRTYRADTVKQSVMAWRRLAQQSGKMPWELTEADIEQHATWMQAEGYSPATIGCALGIFSNFYRWCGERQVDPECQAGFNPAEKVKRPKVRRYRGVKLLSRREVTRLLRTMERDPSELGKRDFAFTLAAFRLGEVIKAEKELAESGKTSEWVEESLAMMDRFEMEAGREPISDRLRKEALGGEARLEVADRRLVEEIAAMRYVLRNAFRLAMEAEVTREHIRLVEIHSNGCERLVKLLRMEKTGTDRLETFLKEGIIQAIKEVNQEMGLTPGPEDTGAG